METAYLHEYRCVAECGSFTAAARELHLTQSTLSKHVAALEREFGADLFVRDRSGLKLTAAGEALYAQAGQLEHVLRQTRGLVHAAAAGAAGEDAASVEGVRTERAWQVRRRLRERARGARHRATPCCAASAGWPPSATG